MVVVQQGSGTGSEEGGMTAAALAEPQGARPGPSKCRASAGTSNHQVVAQVLPVALSAVHGYLVATSPV